MNKYLLRSLAVVLAWGLAGTRVRADYIEYDVGILGKAIEALAGAKLEGMDSITGTTILLPGTVKAQGGPKPVYSYTHPNGTTVHFPMDDVKVLRAKTNQQIFNSMLGNAKTADATMAAAVWGLKSGLLPEFYRAVEKVLKLDPKHEAALKVEALRAQMKIPLPEDKAAEERFHKLVKRPSMHIKSSNHYMLMHDTDESKPAPGKKKTVAQQRLDLLEKVYESFMLLFHAQNVELEVPQERMMVVLFHNYEDFKSFSTAIHPSLASAAGFYDPLSNVAYFYEFSSDDIIQLLDKASDVFRDAAKKAKKWRNNPDAIRLAKVVDLVLDVKRDNSDITVVSHECTHQMAGNTGLFPRHIRTPKWVHEGLASYFEVPSDGVWAGIGAVSRRRITAYRELAGADRNKLVSNVDFVVSDQIFQLGPEFGYAFGWAMTHFMIEKHMAEFVDFYRILGEVPPDVRLNPDLLQRLFHHAVKTDAATLDAEWKDYMKSLKTDLEKLEASEESKKRT